MLLPRITSQDLNECVGKNWIEFSVAETAVKVQLKLLTDAMTKEAYHFFQKMKELDAQDSEFWQSRCEFIKSDFDFEDE